MTGALRTRALLPEPSGRACVRSVRIVLEDGLIAAIDPLTDDDELDHPSTVVPGLIDLQMNGLDEHDLWSIVDADDLDAWSVVENALLDQGVTSWCPTFVSSSRQRYGRLPAFLDRLEQRPPSPPRPRIPGIHLEGPFLGSAIGAHRPEAVAAPDLEWLTTVCSSLGTRLAIMTMGAESELAVHACRLLRDNGTRVSLGHTIPNREQYVAMRGAGADMVTHLFNGMGGSVHRESGMASWVLDDDGVWCGLIADGVHVDPVLIRSVFRAKPDHAFLVTDRVADRLAGMTSDGRAVRRRNGTLAGSLLTMSAALRTCTESASVPMEDAVLAATANPARAMGWNDRGLVAVGYRADLVALDRSFDVTAVWMDGRRVR